MNQNRSYYELLEVELFADPEKVKAAYRRLARQYHPDINPDNPNAEKLFKQIGEAYSVLSDTQKRAAYDQSLSILRKVRPGGAQKETSKRSASGGGAAAGSPNKPNSGKVPPRSKPTGSSKVDSASYTDTQGTKFRDMFDSLFRKDERKPQEPAPKPAPGPQPSAKKPSTPPLRGEDVTVEAMITREEAESGVVKTVNVQHAETCRRCSGTGKVNGTPCAVCHGDKQMLTLRKIEVRVPAGVKAGSKVRVAKEGGRGASGGEPGDLFLVIRIEEDQLLKIDGLTVTCEIPISITEAVLGAEIDVPTLGGKVKMVIPPQTHSGAVFRLKGRGVTLNSSTGDQYVTVQIVSPKTLSPRERELYQELARLQKESPRK